MGNLFGIETEADCRAKLDELLALHERADQTRDKSAVAALKSSLEAYYKKGNTLRGERQMSPVEERYFWPAVVKAFVRAPNLGKRSTWDDGLYEIRLNLTYYRPRE
jgi:hypothetical protein